MKNNQSFNPYPLTLSPISKRALVVLIILLQVQIQITNAINCTVGVNACLVCNQVLDRCQVCQQTYRVNIYYQCQRCNQQNCLECPVHPQLCSLAAPGYGLLYFYYPFACQVNNCFNCDNDNTTCVSCKSGYMKASSTSCISCTVADCRQCPSSNSICSQCKIGYYLSGNACYINTVNFCEVSFALNQCSKCVKRYGLDSFGTCSPCVDEKCINCGTDYNQCTQCQNQFGLSSGNCIKCLDARCVKCRQDATICTQCRLEHYIGLSNNRKCQRCTDPHCYYCHKNNSYCQECHQRKGVNQFGLCVACDDPNCKDCRNNYIQCRYCMPVFGFDENKTCIACQDPECVQCYLNYTVCTRCIQTFGLSGIGECLPCLDSQCLQCYADYRYCDFCIPDYGLYYSNRTCQLCNQSSSQCLDCRQNNIYNCSSCLDKKYLNTTLDICIPCPIFCQLCLQHPYDHNRIQCTLCSDNTTNITYIIDNLLCKAIYCGDQEVGVTEACDNQPYIELDGCDEFCYVMDKFTCWVDLTNRTSSICSYLEQLDIKLLCFDCQPKFNKNINNQYVIRISIFPPLNIFNISTLDQMNQIFDVQGSNIVQKSFKYDHNSGIIQFVCQITDNIVKGDVIQIQFNPSHSYYLEHSKTPSLVIIFKADKTYYHISTFDVTLSKTIFFLCYGVSALGWIACLLGIFLKRLAGIEAMFVLQVAYVSFFLMSGPMLITFEQTNALRYVNGYNHPFLDESTDRVEGYESEKLPYYTQFQFSCKFFINNFNLCMVLQLISFLIIPIMYYRLKDFLEDFQHCQQEQTDQTSQNQKLLTKHIQNYQFSFQLLMSSSMLNLIYFTLCSVLFIKNGTILNIPSLVLFCSEASILLGVFIKFICDPSSFGYFRFSFQLIQLKTRHYCIFIIILPSISVLLILFENMPYLALCPPGLMLLYTLLYRPYKELAENLRSAWNMLVMCSLLFFRVFAQMLCPEGQLNKTTGRAYLMVNLLALLPLTVVIAIISIVYYHWYQNYKTVNGQNISIKDRQNQVKYFRKTLLSQLVKINPNKQMQKIKIQTTFRQLINPGSTLLKQTNKLKEMSQQKKKNQKKANKFNKSKKSTQKQSQDLENYANTDGKDLQQFKKSFLQANKNTKSIGVRLIRSGPQKKEVNNNILQKYKQQLRKQQKIRSSNKSAEQQLKKYNQLAYKQLNLYEQQEIQSRSINQPQDHESPIGKQTGLRSQLHNQNYLYPDASTPEQLKKQIATDILKDEQKFINLQAAIKKVRQDLKEFQDGEAVAMEEYQKIAQGEGSGNGGRGGNDHNDSHSEGDAL